MWDWISGFTALLTLILLWPIIIGYKGAIDNKDTSTKKNYLIGLIVDSIVFVIAAIVWIKMVWFSK